MGLRSMQSNKLMKKYYNADLTLLLIRIGLGVCIFPDGLQKALGWLGGPGFSGTLTEFTSLFHIPPYLTALAILAELLGSLGVIFGFLTRLSAAGVGFTMLVASYYSFPNGYFEGGKGPGVQFFVPGIFIAIALILAGGGEYTLDRYLKFGKRQLANSPVEVLGDGPVNPS